MNAAQTKAVKTVPKRKISTPPDRPISPSSILILPNVTTELAATSPIVQFYSKTLENGYGDGGGLDGGRIQSGLSLHASRTGIPGDMQGRFEAYSGLSFDDVRVHYNSAKPAQLRAFAFTQGNQVHIGPGQEKHLGHELGHVIQQKLGDANISEAQRRTSFNLNLDPTLERRADWLSVRAMSTDLGPQQEEKSYPLGHRSDIVQARLFIGNLVIGHSTEKASTFFFNEVVPWLEGLGYKTYGILSEFRKFIRDDVYFDTTFHFLMAFHKFLKNQVRRVKGGNTVPVLKMFDISKMSRPAWPKALREELLGKVKFQLQGDKRNIRHVVRNATIIRSLLAHQVSAGKDGIRELARNFGIDDGPYDQVARKLYRKLYLNPANLWIGGGTINQVIGLLADPVRRYGRSVAALETQFDPEEFHQLLIDGCAMVRGDEGLKTTAVEEIFRLARECSQNIESESELGLLIEDIGLSLGFDLIDDSSEDIAGRQSNLLSSETGMNRYISGGGGDLNRIFTDFLQSSSSGGMDTEDAIADTDVDETGFVGVGMDIEKEDTEGAWVEIDPVAINNCLIRAIMDAYGFDLDELVIRNIRIYLIAHAGVGASEMLEFEPQTVGLILKFLSIDADAHPLVVYGINSGLGQVTRYVVRGQYGDGDMDSARAIYLEGGHFQADEPVAGLPYEGESGDVEESMGMVGSLNSESDGF